tara:strand:- start:1396 stop:1908 length:513 start_codon:yes stop_codon:yes gene_type:complete
MILDVDRQYLEIKELNSLVEVKKPNAYCKISLLNPPDFQINKFLYKQVGKNHRWIDRLAWSDNRWINYVNNSKVKTYILTEKDELVGYFEQINNLIENEIEIAYFGILENYYGKKYGGYLLSEAIKLSFKNKTLRVWVHTCSLDHKHALNNYQARGMSVFKKEKIRINTA